MPNTNSTAEAIQEMVRFFIPHCTDRSTLVELDDMAADDQLWRHGHALFSRIRGKTLLADKAKDRHRQYQYSFEEICAKTLFNMSGHYDPGHKEFPHPFDEDSPFWVFPIALDFARHLGIEDLLSICSLLRGTDE